MLALLRSRLALFALLVGCTSSSLPSSLPDANPGAAPDVGSTFETGVPTDSDSLAPDGPVTRLDGEPPPDQRAPVGDGASSSPDTLGAPLPDGGVVSDQPDSGGVLILDAAPRDLGPPRDLPPPPDVIYPRFEALPDAPPAPPQNPEAKLLVPGRARLVGTHFTACTNAHPSTTDRWCAFTLPARQIGLTDLWVINVTKALAGTTITCDGTDANCKLLIPPGANPAQGTQLWTGQPMQGPIHPTTHRFDGDTLIFHALAPAVLDQYSGPIYAWRPGWDAPKQISLGQMAYSCSGHATADSYVCIENLTSQTPLQFDLTGGKLSSSPKLIKHIVPFRAGTQSSQWRASLTRDGQTVAFSTGGLTVAERETLYVSRLDAPDVVTTVKVGVSRWSISADGTKVYFLANYNYDTMGAPAGTMTMMDFPSGANEKVLAPLVGAIQVLSEGEVDKGIGFFDNVVAGRATYKIMRDRNVPTATTTVITNIGGVLAVSRDLRLLYYYRDFNMDNGSTTDGYMVKTDGSMEQCSLTTTLQSDQFGTPITQNGSMVLWADNIDQIDGVGEGWVANPDPTGRNMQGCSGRRKFADRVDFWFPRANDGMVYSDQAVLDYSSLQSLPFPGGNSLGTPTLIQNQVNRIYAILPDFKAILYTVVNAPAATDGLIMYSKLPF